MTEEHVLSAESCLHLDGRSEDDVKAGVGALSLDEATAVAESVESMDVELYDAVLGVAPPRYYRSYQARGATRKNRSKENVYGLCLHTPEGGTPGTLSVLNGTRAGFDLFLPLTGELYKCNNMNSYFTWHSGHSWGNPYTIGIEQGTYAAQSGNFGDAHYQRLARLCAYLCETYDLKVAHVQGARPGLMSHASLTPGQRTDPGANFRWDDLIDMIRDHIRGTGPSPKPDPVKPPPDPAPGKTIHRVILDADYEKGTQVFASGTQAGAGREAKRLLDVNGLRTRTERGEA